MNMGQSFTALQVDDVYDIFDLLDKILFKKPMMNQIVYCLYNRSKFIIRFFETLVQGGEEINIQGCSKDHLPSNQHGNEYLYKRGFPLLSQKVFHLNYYNQLYLN